jgi:hypothetical protein
LSTLKTKCESVDLNGRETMAKVKELYQMREDLTARMVSLEKAPAGQVGETRVLRNQLTALGQIVNQLVLEMGAMTQWKQEAIRKQERQETILFNLAGGMAKMVQDQQSLFGVTRGMDAKLDQLLSGKNIALKLSLRRRSYSASPILIVKH